MGQGPRAVRTTVLDPPRQRERYADRRHNKFPFAGNPEETTGPVTVWCRNRPHLHADTQRGARTVRDKPYAGPSDSNDFDNLAPDETAKLLNRYRLLGDCFEQYDDDEMMGRGWLVDGWRDLIDAKQEALARAERELAAAVKLGRHEGATWRDISQLLGITAKEARTRYAAQD